MSSDITQPIRQIITYVDASGNEVQNPNDAMYMQVFNFDENGEMESSETILNPDYQIRETIQGKACGNCRFYVDGGACALVKDAIDPVNGICKFYEGGTPLAYNTQIFPIYEKVEAAYKTKPNEPYLRETIAKNIIDREHQLIADGIPENEVHDILQKEFSDTSISTIINETEWDENKHPRDADGKFSNGGGSGGKQKTSEYFKSQYIPDNDESFDGHAQEPMHLTPEPNDNHKSTAYAVLQNYPNLDEETMIEQAWKADQIRSQHTATLQTSMQLLTDGLPNARVSGRVKTRKSMIDKMGRKEKYKDVSQLGDVSGMRLIVNDINGLDEAKSFVADNFNVTDQDDYVRAPKDGYRALHFEIKNPDGTLSELQVKTPNQHNWSHTVHDKVYKIPEAKKEETMKMMPKIKEYTHAMSDYYFAVDQGQQGVQPPICPPEIDNLGICMQ